MHFKFACFYFVLIHLELKRYIHPFMYVPVVPSKTIPDSRPKWVKCFQTKKDQKTPTLWVVHTGLKMGEENSI